MASAGVAVATPYLAAIPGYGWALAAGAAIGGALIDQYVVMPALAGKGRGAAKAPRLLDTPVGSNEPGAPRIVAYGRRVRVPTHILWQDRKVRESGGSHTKAGTAVVQQRVFIDALVALNDRQTRLMKQLRGNGKLVIGETNLTDVVTSGMVVSVAGSNLVLTMVDLAEPDFTDKLDVDDVVQLAGFISTAGADPNVGYWKVAVVAAHSSTPSYVELAPYSGQVVAGIVATAGTAESPASITRIDDQLFLLTGATLVPFPTTPPYQGVQVFIDTSGFPDPLDVFVPGEVVRTANMTLAGYGSLDAVRFHVNVVSSGHLSLSQISGTPALPFSGAITCGTATNAARVHHESAAPLFANGLFASGFIPADHYHDGSEDQDEDALLAAVEGTGEVPAYRGVAYQTLDQFYVDQFGGVLPFSLEAVIEVDQGMTVAQCVREILLRAGIPDDAIDTWGVEDQPLEGFFLRGAVPTITAIQPLLVAYGLLGQERDGVISMFSLENADVVQIANGSQFTDLGTHIYGEKHEDVKIVVEDTSEQDLPTSCGVRHQDPDNGYADGYQPFGLRHPGGPEFQNNTEIDVSNLVLTRKQARNLAETSVRRAHINRRTYRLVLPMRYMHLLENDLVTFTDDDDNDITARIIQRDIGADLRVAILAIAEDVDVAVVGSPVQSAAGNVPPRVDTATSLQVLAVDIPALTDQEWSVPAIKVAVAASNGGVWTGASLWVSSDGTNYTFRKILGVQAGIGTLVGTLNASPAAESYGTTAVTFDDTITVDVDFTNEGPAGLQDATQAQAEAGANWCAIIDPDGNVELAAFLTATFASDRTWTLGSFLRGLRGTSPVEHAEGARVVLLSPFYGSGVEHIEFPGASQPVTLSLKVVPAGKGLDDVEAVQVVSTWRNALPLPVRSISKTIYGSPFDARFTVDAAWCRSVLPLGTQPPHPMDDLPEGYRFTIYSPAGDVVRRTFTLQANPTTGSPHIRDKWFDYTAAMQTLDGYTPSALETFWVDVQQIGAAGLGPSIKQEL